MKIWNTTTVVAGGAVVLAAIAVDSLYIDRRQKRGIGLGSQATMLEQAAQKCGDALLTAGIGVMTIRPPSSLLADCMMGSSTRGMAQ